MQFGDYRISNSLILIVFITSVIGLGVAKGATDSIADAATSLVSGPQDNSSQTDDRPAAKQETDGENPDSSGEAADKSDSDTGESGETADDNNSRGPDKHGSDSQKGDQLQEENGGQNAGNEKSAEGPVEPSASISQPGNGEIINTDSVKLQASVSGTNASYEVRLDGGLQESGDLDGNKEISSTLNINSDGMHTVKILVLKSGETQASEVSQFSINTGTDNSTDSATISLFDPSSQTYTTNTIPLLATLEATDATYQVKVDGQTRLSGTVAGTTEISQDLTITDGSHEIGITITRSQKTLASETVNIDVDSTNSNTAKNGFYKTENLTAGETTVVRLYKNGDPVTGKTVYFGDGTEADTTNQYGEITFKVPNQKEITLSTDSFEEAFDVQNYSSEIDFSFSFARTLYQGRQNTLTVTDGAGSSIEDATIYVNGIEKGVTNSTGKLSFMVPDTSKLTIKANRRDSSKNNTYAVEKPPIDLLVLSPTDGQNFGSYKAGFNLEVNSSSRGTLEIFMDGTRRVSQSISSGQNIIDKELIIENSGAHNFTVSISNQEETISKKGTFSTAEDVPAPKIFINAPTEGQSLGDSSPRISVDFDSIDPFDYSIKVDGRNIGTGSLPSGTPSISTTAYCLLAQQHQLNVTATSQDTGRSSFETVLFETTSSPPSVAKDIFKPTKGASLQSPVTFNYTIVGCRDSVSYDVYIEQAGSRVKNIDSGTLGKYEKVTAPNMDFSLSSGNYSFVISGQNQVNLSFSVQ